MQIKRGDGKGRALCCGNDRVDAIGGHYQVQIKRVDGKGSDIMNVEMKGWMEKVAL